MDSTVIHINDFPRPNSTLTRHQQGLKTTYITTSIANAFVQG